MQYVYYITILISRHLTVPEKSHTILYFLCIMFVDLFYGVSIVRDPMERCISVFVYKRELRVC